MAGKGSREQPRAVLPDRGWRREGASRAGVAPWVAPAVCLLQVPAAWLAAAALHAPAARFGAWVCLLPLFLAVRVLTPAAAALAGTIWAAVLWITSPSLHMLPAPLPQASLLLVGVIAVYAGLGAALTRAAGFSSLLLGLGWVGVEFALRPLGLPNGLLGGTQWDGALSRLVGSVLGYVFVAFIIATANALLLGLLASVSIARPGRRPGRWPRSERTWPSWCATIRPGRTLTFPLIPRAPPPARLIPA